MNDGSSPRTPRRIRPGSARSWRPTFEARSSRDSFWWWQPSCSIGGARHWPWFLSWPGPGASLLLLGRHFNPPQTVKDQYTATPVINWLRRQGVGEDKRIISFGAFEVLPGSLIQVFGLRSCNGLLSMLDRETGELMRALETSTVAKNNPCLTAPLTQVESLHAPVLDMIGAHFVSTGSLGYLEIQEDLKARPGLELAYVNRKERTAVFKRKDALKPAYLVNRLCVMPETKERLAHMMSPSFDPACEAVIESVIESVPLKGLSSGTVEYRRPFPERIEIEVDCRGPAFLVISESGFPGWCAEADGMPAPLLKANHALMGVPLDGESRQVVLTYRPWSFFIGAGMSLVGLIVVAGVPAAP